MKITLKMFLLLLIMATVILSGCMKEDSKIKNEIITLSNLSELYDKIKTDKNFKKEDIDLFTAGMSRLSTQSDSLYGKTVGQIISEEEEFLRNSSLASLNTSLFSVTHFFNYIGWDPLEENGHKLHHFTFVVLNKTKQDIKKIQGIFKFINSQNQIIRGFNLPIEQVIKAGTNVQLSTKIPFDENNQSDKALWEILSNKTPGVYWVWQPQLIEFSDGKKIQAPENLIKQ